MIRVALKSLLGRKVRLLMSTFAIVLGVAFVTGTFMFTDTLNRSFTAIFASSVGDVVVSPVEPQRGGPTAVTIPASVVEDLAAVEGAARADGNVTSIGTFVVDPDGKVVGGQGAPGLAANYTDAPAGQGLEGLRIVTGEVPEGIDEVALDEATAERAGYAVGDVVSLVTSGARATLSPTLVGLVGYGEGGGLNGATLTVFDTATAQELYLDGQDAYSDVWVTAAEGVSQEDLRDAVAAEVPASYSVLTGDEAAEENASALLEAISFITTFLLVFAGVALVVGSFLIVNTFSILVAQRSRELALLRALGASRRQVTRSVLLEAFVLGLVGSTLGLGLGMVLAQGIRALFANFGLDMSGTPMVLAPRTVLAAYAVGVVVTVVAAYLPARRSARIEPVQALRDDIAMPEGSIHRRMLVGSALIVVGAAAMATGLLADVPQPVWWVGLGILAVLLGVSAASPVISRPFLAMAAAGYRRAFGTVGTLAGENARRNPRRTTATASALMIGLALVTTMTILGRSAGASVDQTIEENFSGDVVVSNAVGVPFSPQVANALEGDPAVGSVTRVRFAQLEVEGETRFGIGIDPGSVTDVVTLEMVDGDIAGLGPGEVLLAEDEADESGLGVGDEVVIAMPTGEQRLEVVGVYVPTPFAAAPFMVAVETLREGGYPDEDNSLFLTRATPDGQEALITAARDATTDIPLISVKDQEGYAEEQRAPIDQLLLLIYGLLGLALVIAVLGIVNTLALSVIERTREVGLLRAVGLSRAQLRRMIGLESVVIAVLGTLLGVVMGIVFGLALLSAFADEGLEAVVVPYGQLLGFVVAAVVVGVLAALLPARRAARLDVLQAIATE
ncbi:MAG: FtsX-like permease family protein [Nocardioides sp.]|nr:FtsX-like permease family protein [Nocardioides sp.]